MFLLPETKRSIIHEHYAAEDAYFPLIAAVLLGIQKGNVYGNSKNSPSSFYVEHDFGFSQLLGIPDAKFTAIFKKNLLSGKFDAQKARIYGVGAEGIFSEADAGVSHAIRQRFCWEPIPHPALEHLLSQTSGDVSFSPVNHENIDLVESSFNVVNRFWSNKEDFIGGAHAVLASYNNKAAALCYSAATVQGKSEIDIMTLPQHRKKGLGKLVLAAFLKECLENSIEPLWDCFTNNEPSMKLCESLGFRPKCPPYPFYTVPKIDYAREVG